MNKNFSGSIQRARTGVSAPSHNQGAVEPLAVGPKKACILADVGMTRLYQLLNAGEYDSYWEGRHRKITVESIRRRQERLLAEAQKGGIAKPSTPFEKK